MSSGFEKFKKKLAKLEKREKFIKPRKPKKIIIRKPKESVDKVVRGQGEMFTSAIELYREAYKDAKRDFNNYKNSLKGEYEQQQKEVLREVKGGKGSEKFIEIIDKKEKIFNEYVALFNLQNKIEKEIARARSKDRDIGDLRRQQQEIDDKLFAKENELFTGKNPKERKIDALLWRFFAIQKKIDFLDLSLEELQYTEYADDFRDLNEEMRFLDEKIKSLRRAAGLAEKGEYSIFKAFINEDGELEFTDIDRGDLIERSQRKTDSKSSRWLNRYEDTPDNAGNIFDSVRESVGNYFLNLMRGVDRRDIERIEEITENHHLPPMEQRKPHYER